MLETVPAC